MYHKQTNKKELLTKKLYSLYSLKKVILIQLITKKYIKHYVAYENKVYERVIFIKNLI